MYNPRKAAHWLSERLNRPISYDTIHTYIEAGDLEAVNTSAAEKRPRWIVTEEALERLLARVGPDGKLPTPTGGWPQYRYPEGKKRNRKKADGLVNNVTKPPFAGFSATALESVREAPPDIKNGGFGRGDWI